MEDIHTEDTHTEDNRMAGRRMDTPDKILCLVYSGGSNHDPDNHDACNLPGDTWSFVTLLFHRNLFKAGRRAWAFAQARTDPVRRWFF